MDRAFEAFRITDDVYWVGAIDWEVRNFHGYLTSKGTTYNAFLVLADKVTLIDTVKAPFRDEMFSRIASVIDPHKIDYIVSNHSEMDHTGSLPQTVHIVKPEKIFASRMGQRALASHFPDMTQSITVVGDGDTIDLGGKKISFVETKMCHWPDSMVSYLHDDGIMFSQDAFGMHLASYERFADELDPKVLNEEAAKYYANILLHLSPFIDKTLDKIDSLGLDINMVAPDHGPIWRRDEDIAGIMNSYAHWSKQEPTNKAVILYDTMWQSSSKMARAIGEGLSSGGAEVKLLAMGSAHRSDVATELLDAGAIVVGSPTINNGLFPTLADVMCYIKGLKPKNLIGAAFGSFGWSGEAPRQLHEMLEDMGVDTISGPLRVNYVPDETALQQCQDLGMRVAEANKARLTGEAVPAEKESPPPSKQKFKIDINSGMRELTVTSGDSVFVALQKHEIFLPTICGGQGMCGQCKLTVFEGGSEITPAERQHLTHAQLEAGLRLGCQVIVQNDLKIEIAEESLGANQFKGEVVMLSDLNHDIKQLRIKLTEPKQIEFIPGQYVKLNVPISIDPAEVSRAYSFANSPGDKGFVDLMVRKVPGGVCTSWVFGRLKPGDEISFSGPFGSFGLSDSGREMVWIGGGSGMSPFMSMMEFIQEQKQDKKIPKCTLFFGAVQKKDLVLVEKMQSLAEELDWFTFVPALSAPADDDDWSGETGLITDVVARNIKDGSDMEAYLCGSPGMIDASIKMLLEIKFDDSRIFRDDHTHIAGKTGR